MWVNQCLVKHLLHVETLQLITVVSMGVLRYRSRMYNCFNTSNPFLNKQTTNLSEYNTGSTSVKDMIGKLKFL